MFKRVYVLIAMLLVIVLFSCADPNDAGTGDTATPSSGAVPVWCPERITFNDTDMSQGQYGGIVSFHREYDREDDITKYLLYAGSDSATPVGEPIGSINKVYSKSSFEIDDDTMFIDSITHFLVFSANESGRSATPAAVELLDSAPYEIEALKNPSANISYGTKAYVSNAVVTAIMGPNHYWISTAVSNGSYGGINIFNSAGTASLAVGDMVNVYGTYKEYHGTIQIAVESNPLNEVLSHGNQLPVPAVVLPSQIATGGASSEIYEGFPVTVENVTVTALNVDGNAPNFTVDEGLIIDDDMYSEVPLLGDSYTSITGILYHSGGVYRLLPRDANDIVK